jgi:hypothetical protein
MTDSVRVFDPGFRVTDANGAVVSGALVKFFDAGGSTPRTVYSDSGLSVSLGVEVECNSAGAPSSDGNAPTLIYTGTTAYRVRITDSSGTVIPGMDFDNISGALDTTPFAAATFAKPDTDCAAATANTTLTTDDLGTVQNGNPTGGTFTYTLPSAITATNGRGYTFRHVGTANSIIIATVSAQTIDGVTTKTISSRYETLEIVSDGANWHVKGDANRQIVGGTIHPQGYLTLTSATPILSGDVTAATAVYYTPFTGNLLPLYDGTRFVNYEFEELTLTLASQHAINTLYDVFAWLESGVVTIGTGPAWSVSTAGSGARGTGAGTTQLTRTKGLHLNTVAMTARNSSTTYSVGALRATWLGTVHIDGTAGQITCHRAWGQSRKWGVWNAYNRQLIMLQGGDPTSAGSPWNYTSATIRASNGSSANSLSVLCGLAEEMLDCLASQAIRATNAALTTVPQIAIGINSTTTRSGTSGFVAGDIGGAENMVADGQATARYSGIVGLGLTTVTHLEKGSGATGTFFGTQEYTTLEARWRG